MTSPAIDADVSGTIRPEVAARLGAHVNIASGSTAHTTALIDGQAGDYNSADVRGAIDANKVVVLIEPTDSQLADLGDLTGVSASSGVRAVAVARDARGVARLSALGTLETSAPLEVDDESTTSPGEAPADVAGAAESVRPLLKGASDFSLGASISQLVKAVAPAKPGLLRAQTELNGPDGAYAGIATVYHPMSGRIACVGDDAKSPYAGRCQDFSAVGDNSFHVFYNDGAREPHYVVILRQRLTFNAGNLHTDLPGCRGYFMYGAQSSIHDVASHGSGVRLVATSPDTGAAQATVRQDMSLTQEVQGGTAVRNTTVAEGTALTLPDWTVTNRSVPASAIARFDFQQTNLNMGDVLNSVFADAWRVKDLPAISKGTLSATTYAVWNIMGNKRPILTGTLQLNQRFMIVANRDVWHRHKNSAWWIEHWQPVGFRLDLAQIARVP